MLPDFPDSCGTKRPQRVFSCEEGISGGNLRREFPNKKQGRNSCTRHRCIQPGTPRSRLHFWWPQAGWHWPGRAAVAEAFTAEGSVVAAASTGGSVAGFMGAASAIPATRRTRHSRTRAIRPRTAIPQCGIRRISAITRGRQPIRALRAVITRTPHTLPARTIAISPAADRRRGSATATPAGNKTAERRRDGVTATRQDGDARRDRPAACRPGSRKNRAGWSRRR